MKMNPKIKEKWLKALRSGEYKQGRESLRKDDKYCCLGVLCDIAPKKLGMWGTQDTGFIAEDGTQTNISLPYLVRNWAGMETSNGVFPGGLAKGILPEKTIQSLTTYYITSASY